MFIVVLAFHGCPCFVHTELYSANLQISTVNKPYPSQPPPLGSPLSQEKDRVPESAYISSPSGKIRGLGHGRVGGVFIEVCWNTKRKEEKQVIETWRTGATKWTAGIQAETIYPEYAVNFYTVLIIIICAGSFLDHCQFYCMVNHWHLTVLKYNYKTFQQHCGLTCNSVSQRNIIYCMFKWWNYRSDLWLEFLVISFLFINIPVCLATILKFLYA